MNVQNETAGSEPSTLSAGEDVSDELAAVLARATLALGRAGQPVPASRFAASGYVVLWRQHPDAARRLHAALHALARMPTPPPPARSPEESAMPETTTLDVRTEPPVRRHELIFSSFDELPVGDAFELVNDHDPKPLYYQLEAEQTGRFTWEYLEQGPQVWRVKIGRTA